MSRRTTVPPGLPQRPTAPIAWAGCELKSPLEWSAVDKVAALLVVPLPILVGYVIRITYLLFHPEHEPYIDRDLLRWVDGALVGYVGMVAGLLAAWRTLRRHPARAGWFVRTALVVWLGFLAVVTYLAGPFSTPALAGFLAACLGVVIAFEVRVALFAIGIGVAIVFGSVVLEQMGLIPYGPVFGEVPMNGGHPEPEWVLYNSIFSAAILALSLAVMVPVMVLWRHRDAEVRWLASVDELTGLANRRHFFERLEEELERAARYGDPMSLILIDLDHFKRINDEHGHQAGDRVLATVGSAIREGGLRRVDVAGRYGGEELALMLPSTDVEGAIRVAERIRGLIEELPVETTRRERIRITASLGVAVHPHPPACDVDALVRRADRALYAAKDAGRNQVRLEVCRLESLMPAPHGESRPSKVSPLPAPHPVGGTASARMADAEADGLFRPAFIGDDPF